MKIGIDASSISIDKAGIGYYSLSMIKALSQVDKKNEYYLFTNDSANLKDLGLSENFKIIELKSKRVNTLWIVKVVRYLKKNNFDTFLSPSNFSFGALYPNTVQIVHDLAPIKFPKFFSKKGSLSYKALLNLCMRRCKYIFTSTQTIKNEIIKYNPKIKEKVKAGGFGVHDWVFEVPSKELQKKVIEKYNLPEKFFLSVSTLEPRKNHINMIKGFNKFWKENLGFHYVIIGKKGWYYKKIFEAVEKCEAKENIHFLGYVPEEELGSIYDCSKGVIMLSFYEGIGLSPLEAQVRGVPVLTSDIPIFHEVLGTDSIYADPTDVNSIKIGMDSLKKSKRKPRKLNRKNDWTDSARALLKLLVD